MEKSNKAITSTEDIQNPILEHKDCGTLNKFLWTCAGVNKDVLKQCPSDYAKYAGIGGTILFTALMAALSGGYALNLCLKIRMLRLPLEYFGGY